MARLAAAAASAATTRGALRAAPELAMTVAVCSATTVVVTWSVTRVMTPRLLIAPVLELLCAAFVVPVIRNMLEPSSWFAVMIDRVDVVVGLALLGVPALVLVVGSDGDGDDVVCVDGDGNTTRVVSAVSDELLLAVAAEPDEPDEPEADDGDAVPCVVPVVCVALVTAVPDDVASVPDERVSDAEDVPTRMAVEPDAPEEPGSVPELVAEVPGSVPESAAEVVGRVPDPEAEGVPEADGVWEPAAAPELDVWPGRMWVGPSLVEPAPEDWGWGCDWDWDCDSACDGVPAEGREPELVALSNHVVGSALSGMLPVAEVEPGSTPESTSEVGAGPCEDCVPPIAEPDCVGAVVGPETVGVAEGDSEVSSPIHHGTLCVLEACWPAEDC